MDYKDRIKLTRDALNFKKTQRTPLFSNCSTWHILDAGYTFTEALYNWDIMLKASEEFISRFEFDSYKPLIGRNPLAFFDSMGANRYIVSDEVVARDDYELIASDEYYRFAHDNKRFFWETILPRKAKAALQDNAYDCLDKAIVEYKKMAGYQTQLNKILEEHGVPKESKFGGGGTRTPFEDFFNNYRGIKGLSTDVRRHRDAVKEACEFMGHNQIEAIKKKIADNNGAPNEDAVFDFASGNNSHSILNNRQFEDLIWPFYRDYFNLLADNNMSTIFTVQAQILRLSDYYNEVKKGVCAVGLEMDDPFEFRKTVPNMCIIGAMTTDYLGYKTPQECVDYAKKCIDELGTNGGLILSQNKLLTYRNDAKRENLLAVNEFVKGYKA